MANYGAILTIQFEIHFPYQISIHSQESRNPEITTSELLTALNRCIKAHHDSQNIMSQHPQRVFSAPRVETSQDETENLVIIHYQDYTIVVDLSRTPFYEIPEGYHLKGSLYSLRTFERPTTVFTPFYQPTDDHRNNDYAIQLTESLDRIAQDTQGNRQKYQDTVPNRRNQQGRSRQQSNVRRRVGRLRLPKRRTNEDDQLGQSDPSNGASTSPSNGSSALTNTSSSEPLTIPRLERNLGQTSDSPRPIPFPMQALTDATSNGQPREAVPSEIEETFDSLLRNYIHLSSETNEPNVQVAGRTSQRNDYYCT